MTIATCYLKVLAAAGLAALVGACASHPPPPDWQMNAKGASESAITAYLTGDTHVEVLEFDRMRRAIARTGDINLMARAELLRCATRVASLVLEDCAAFEALRSDAATPERAYADYLAGRLRPQDVVLLPPQHRAAAAHLLEGGTMTSGDTATLSAIADPLARLVAASVWFRAGQAHPAVMALAVETASSQGWNRPLLAWLQVQARHAELGGDAAEAQRLRRRVELVLRAGGAPDGIKPLR
ncbi:MAG: hypothetical protein M3A44_06275 [Gammaproteobacteria bacterium]